MSEVLALPKLWFYLRIAFEGSTLDFRVNNDNKVEIEQICHLVEGMPLAIELATTWVRLLSLSEIAQEIQRNLDFLSTNMRDVPDEHRSIRAVFDHSWGLLTKEEQQVLSRLSVFRGGFTLEAAKQVAGASLAILSSLASKSLVQRTEVGRYQARLFGLAGCESHA